MSFTHIHTYYKSIINNIILLPPTDLDERFFIITVVVSLLMMFGLDVLIENFCTVSKKKKEKEIK